MKLTGYLGVNWIMTVTLNVNLKMNNWPESFTNDIDEDPQYYPIDLLTWKGFPILSDFEANTRPSSQYRLEWDFNFPKWR